MKPATTVYLVTSGSYSEYTVEAVFSTRALAQAFVAAAGGDDIEERTLDERAAERRVFEFVCAMALADGSCRHRWPEGRPVCAVPTRRARVDLVSAWGVVEGVEVWSQGSQEHAHKVAVEQRQRYLATGQIEASPAT